MFDLRNSELRLELIDPAIEFSRLGPRFGWGGYIWQVHDSILGPLLSGPEWPNRDPAPFNGQGAPESFRHRTRAGRPLTWSGDQGVAIGVGTVSSDAGGNVVVTEPCRWSVTPAATEILFQTSQNVEPFSYGLSRRIILDGRVVTSETQLTNHSDAPLALEWFAHPFWPLKQGRATIALPRGSSVPDNPGFAITADGSLSFKRPFLEKSDDQFALLTLPANQALMLSLEHPTLARVTSSTSFVPDECPVWANASTVSVEPYLKLQLAPGESRRWQLQHRFER